MQISRIRLSDKTSRLSFRVQRHLQFLNTFRSLIGCPISRSVTTYCVCLELRSLPSTGVTRLQLYYEPLRHPRAPGLSLAGFQLVIADHALGLPVFRALSLCTCCRHYPGAASGRTASLTSPSRISLPRKGCRVGLRIVLFEACSAFTRVAACTLALSPYFVTRYPKASAILLPPWLLRLLPAGAVAGWGLHPLENAALSRRTPEADMRRSFNHLVGERQQIVGQF